MEEHDIAALVKRLRERMGLTQEQFAQEVGVTFSTVNQWENGRRRPQPYLMNRLLDMDASSQQKPVTGQKSGRRAKREH